MSQVPRDSILIADEDAQARESMARAFRNAGFKVDEAVDGEQALALARETDPAAVILEVALSGVSGYEVCRALKSEQGDELPVVFASGTRTEPYDRVAGLLIGADDYVSKPCAPDELLVRVRNLLRRAAEPPVTASPARRLTKREREILRLLADGLQQRDIASGLFISPKTVATHIENIMRKLAVHNRAQAVAVAYREALLDRRDED